MDKHFFPVGWLPRLSSFPGLPEMFGQKARMSGPNVSIFEQNPNHFGGHRDGLSGALRGSVAYRLAGRLCTMTVVAGRTGVSRRSLEESA